MGKIRCLMDKSDCFAYNKDKEACGLLREEMMKCPFYKSREQLKQEKKCLACDDWDGFRRISKTTQISRDKIYEWMLFATLIKTEDEYASRKVDEFFKDYRERSTHNGSDILE